jgi:hypothetical protein
MFVPVPILLPLMLLIGLGSNLQHNHRVGLSTLGLAGSPAEGSEGRECRHVHMHLHLPLLSMT